MKIDLSKPMTPEQRHEYINEILSQSTLTELERNTPVFGCVSGDLDKENIRVQVEYNGYLEP